MIKKRRVPAHDGEWVRKRKPANLKNVRSLYRVRREGLLPTSAMSVYFHGVFGHDGSSFQSRRAVWLSQSDRVLAVSQG